MWRIWKRIKQYLRGIFASDGCPIIIEREEEKTDLRMMTVEQLIDSDLFAEELVRQIELEDKHHNEVARQAYNCKLRLTRAPIDSLRERGVFNAEDFVDLYKRIICKQLNGFSAAEREYIRRVCMQAYWRVVERNK